MSGRDDDPQRAAARLYETYQGAVYATCRSVLDSPDDAADATQEVFAKALPVLHGVRHPCAWLLTAARHHCIDVVRRRRLGDRTVAPEWGRERQAPDPADVVAKRDQAASVLAALPDRERLALTQVAVGDASVGEVASLMGISYAAALQLLSRARRRAAQVGQVPSALASAQLRPVRSLLQRIANLMTNPSVAPRGAAGGSALVLCAALACGGGGTPPVASAQPTPPPIAAPVPPQPHPPATTRAAVAGAISTVMRSVPAAQHSVDVASSKVKQAVCGAVPASVPQVVWTHANQPDGSSSPLVSSGAVQVEPEVRLVKGTMSVVGTGLSAQLVVRVYVEDMALPAATPVDSANWYVSWGSTTMLTASASTSMVSFQLASTGASLAGHVVDGPGGYLEWDVPLTALGIGPGTVLHGVSTIAANNGGYEQTAPDVAPLQDYTIPQTC